MSYILEALKRAERERKLGQPPAALDEVAAPPPVTHAKPGPRTLLIGLAAIVVVALAGYAVFLFRGPPTAAPTVTPELPSAAAPAPAPAPAPVTVAATPDGTVDARIEDGGQIASLDDLTDPNADPAATELAAAQQSAARQAPSAASFPADAALEADTPSTLRAPNPAPPASRPVPVPTPTPTEPPPSSSIQLDANPLTAAAPTSEPPAEPATLQPVPPPPAQPAAPTVTETAAQAPEFRRLKDMPAGFRAEFPALSVDVHVYNDNPQRRFVLITGKRYRETDAIAEGPRIARIVPEGIVFDWRNEQVLFPVR